MTDFNYLGQTTNLKDTTKEEIYARINVVLEKEGNTPR